MKLSYFIEGPVLKNYYVAAGENRALVKGKTLGERVCQATLTTLFLIGTTIISLIEGLFKLVAALLTTPLLIRQWKKPQAEWTCSGFIKGAGNAAQLAALSICSLLTNLVYGRFMSLPTIEKEDPPQTDGASSGQERGPFRPPLTSSDEEEGRKAAVIAQPPLQEPSASPAPKQLTPEPSPPTSPELPPHIVTPPLGDEIPAFSLDDDSEKGTSSILSFEIVRPAASSETTSSTGQISPVVSRKSGGGDGNSSDTSLYFSN